MANICYTFEIDGRPAYMAFTSEDDARSRLSKGFDVIEHGRSVLQSGSVVSMRPSASGEIGAFVRLAAETCLSGRIEWEDVMDGYVIFLIPGRDPNFPERDINTGLSTVGTRTHGSQEAGQAPRSFSIDIADLIALHEHAPPCAEGRPDRAARQRAEAVC